MKEKQNQSPRSGLKIRCLGIEPYLRDAAIKFAKWLRKRVDFPIRVIVYLKKDYYIKTRKGELVSAVFWGPDEKTMEPYIRIATGDVKNIHREYGKISAKCSVVASMAHEIAHYEQWVKGKKFSERAAKKRTEELMNKYGYVRGNNK